VKTIRWRIEKETGVSSRVLADYEARGWLPPAEVTDEEECLRQLRLVRLMRGGLTPREVDQAMVLLGAERRTGMPRLMAVEGLDQALQAALRISPQAPVDELKREILNRDPRLYEELRAESSA
jgi:DNA-binding transcriptional MerR regulator